MRYLLGIALLSWGLTSCSSTHGNDEKAAKENAFANPVVHHRGKVMKVHRENDFTAHVDLDTLEPKNLFALGPVEGLDGELFIKGDRGFVYRLDTAAKNTFTDKNWRVEKAAFLVWSYVENWDTLKIEKGFNTTTDLETIIAHYAAIHSLDTLSAFPFMAMIPSSSGKGHVMNESLRKSSNDRGHKDAKFGFEWRDQPTQLLGFFSPNHGGIFTHHNERLHIHFRLGNKYQGGHVDAIEVGKTDWLLILPSD